MCGILGNYLKKTIKNSSVLHDSIQLLTHRGPDDSGVFQCDQYGIGLAHTRLSILDLSQSGHQPIFSADGQVVMVYNGEIYNFLQLREELQRKGYQFHGSSDTEVLLNLYLDQGENVTEKINGIFAFAIWDLRKESLFIARDGMGVKPLYYSVSDMGFSFASEVKALLKLDTSDNHLDHDSLSRYLTFLWCPGEGTPLKSVKKLQPGEALIVKKGKIVKKWKWYQLPTAQHGIARTSKKDTIYNTQALLRQAVHRQMVADVPVGAFLSGGLDSSAVVAFARELNPNIRCFTIETLGGKEQGLVEDVPYAKKVAKHLDVELDVVSVDAQKMANDLQRMVVQLDEPLADPAPLNVLYISQLAKSNGIKVLLSGAGGDDLFTGYRRHFALSLENYWNWMPISIRRILETQSSKLDHRNPLFRRVAKAFSGSGLTADERLVNYFRWTKKNDVCSLLTHEFKQAIQCSRPEDPMLSFLNGLPDSTNQLDKILALEQRFFLADHNLIYTDKMSMAASVEVRVPFLDNDLVEFAAQIPAKYKQRGKEGKWVLKKAMVPYLPHDVIYRSKTGFGAPLRSWMRFELRELLGDLLSEESLFRRGLFDPKAVQQLISENDAGTKDASYTLLSLLCIEIWCRAYLDKSMPT